MCKELSLDNIEEIVEEILADQGDVTVEDFPTVPHQRIPNSNISLEDNYDIRLIG